MNSFTRIGLPILLVAGVVFAITFATRYTTEPDENLPGMPGKNGAQGKDAAKPKELPLKFYTTQVGGPITANTTHLKYWSNEVEVEQQGGYGFWVSNKHPQPVQLQATDASCTCTNVEVANVPNDAMTELTLLSAIGNSPLLGMPIPAISAFGHVKLSNQLDWQVMFTKEQKKSVDINAAQDSKPQLAIIKMKWNGKAPEGPKNLNVSLISNLPDGSLHATRLEASILVVPSYALLVRNGTKWDFANELNFGELGENSNATREVFAVSSKRLYLPLISNLEGESTPCITISNGVPATSEEINSLLNYTVDGNRFMSSISTMTKYTISVKERVLADSTDNKSLKQLDLGVVDRRVRFTGENGNDNRSIFVRGRVMGDIRILAGSANGKVDMGTGFSIDQDQQRVLTIIAERDGLDVSLLENEVVPNYLKVKLEPQKPIDGRKTWRLTVTIPKGTLFGALPINSVIMLKTNDATPRRLRLPVVGSAYDSGTPRI